MEEGPRGGEQRGLKNFRTEKRTRKQNNGKKRDLGKNSEFRNLGKKSRDVTG